MFFYSKNSFYLYTAHKDDVVHGVTPNTNGIKYTLILKNHPAKEESMVRLSKDMVKNANVTATNGLWLGRDPFGLWLGRDPFSRHKRH